MRGSRKKWISKNIDLLCVDLPEVKQIHRKKKRTRITEVSTYRKVRNVKKLWCRYGHNLRTEIVQCVNGGGAISLLDDGYLHSLLGGKV